MGLGDKVIASSKPNEEMSGAADIFIQDEEDEGSFEGPGPDDDCFCICFCEDDEEEENNEDNKENVETTQNSIEDGAGDDEEEAELVDPYDEIKQSCGEKEECAKLKQKFDECTARVESRSKTAETCAEELIDFMHCIDHCASKKLFSKLK